MAYWLSTSMASRIASRCSKITVLMPPDSGVTLRLLAGSLEVDAAPRPADRPLIFATDHARFYFQNNLQIRTLPEQRRTQLHVLS